MVNKKMTTRKKAKIILRITKIKINDFVSNLLDWIFKDVVYTILPILVILFINNLSANDESISIPITELSYATIVSFGTGLTRFIKLKKEVQKDNSQKIYGGTRMLILLLIASVIVLSLAVLNENGMQINRSSLITIQLFLFTFSLCFLFMSNSEEAKQNQLEKTLPPKIDRSHYFELVNWKIDRINTEIEYLQYALRKYPEIKFTGNDIYKESHIWEKIDREKLYIAYSNTANALKEIKPLIIEIIDFPLPNSDNQ